MGHPAVCDRGIERIGDAIGDDGDGAACVAIGADQANVIPARRQSPRLLCRE